MPLTDETPPPRLPRPLDAVELRVLGALLEKQQATPEYYPLTLHALAAACNQKTNRDPVTDLDEAAVLAALERLREHVLVWKTGGARAEKWEQNVDRRWSLDAGAKAVMTLLLLRGEQTPGELRGRSERLHAFATPGEVEAALQRLEDLPLGGVVVTDIDRDGTGAGPDMAGLAHVLALTGLQVVASGGIAGTSDLVALAGLGAGARRLAGVIVGRALLSGALSISEPVAACEQ